MKTTTAIVTALSVTVLASSCNQEKKVATEAAPPPPTELSAYTPKKDGDWINVDDIWRFRNNASLQLKKFGDWIGASWFRMGTMRRAGNFMRPADTIYNIIEEESGVNPKIIYSCLRQDFGLDFGTAMESIQNSSKETSYFIFRFDGIKHYAEKNWQTEPRTLKGINPATGELKKVPKGIPETYKEPNDPLNNLLRTSKIIEVSVVDNIKEPKRGVYAKWILPTTLKEQKATGDLDRACKALIGADYITVAIDKEQTNAEKKEEEQKKKAEELKKAEPAKKVEGQKP
jgi:hypothetical protein